MNLDFRVKVAMSLMRALWGEITPEVRAVLARIDGGNSLTIEFYLDGDTVEQFVETASCVEGEVMGDFPVDFNISHKVMRLDAPKKVPIGDSVLVYFRKESE